MKRSQNSTKQAALICPLSTLYGIEPSASMRPTAASSLPSPLLPRNSIQSLLGDGERGRRSDPSAGVLFVPLPPLPVPPPPLLQPYTWCPKSGKVGPPAQNFATVSMRVALK